MYGDNQYYWYSDQDTSSTLSLNTILYNQAIGRIPTMSVKKKSKEKSAEAKSKAVKPEHAAYEAYCFRANVCAHVPNIGTNLTADVADEYVNHIDPTGYATVNRFGKVVPVDSDDAAIPYPILSLKDVSVMALQVREPGGLAGRHNITVAKAKWDGLKYGYALTYFGKPHAKFIVGDTALLSIQAKEHDRYTLRALLDAVNGAHNQYFSKYVKFYNDGWVREIPKYVHLGVVAGSLYSTYTGTPKNVELQDGAIKIPYGAYTIMDISSTRDDEYYIDLINQSPDKPFANSIPAPYKKMIEDFDVSQYRKDFDEKRLKSYEVAKGDINEADFEVASRIFDQAKESGELFCVGKSLLDREEYEDWKLFREPVKEGEEDDNAPSKAEDILPQAIFVRLSRSRPDYESKGKEFPDHVIRQVSYFVGDCGDSIIKPNMEYAKKGSKAWSQVAPWWIGKPIARLQEKYMFREAKSLTSIDGHDLVQVGDEISPNDKWLVGNRWAPWPAFVGHKLDYAALGFAIRPSDDTNSEKQV